MIVDIMGGYLRRNAPRGSSANWTEVVKEYKQGVQQDIELSDDGIVAFEDDSNTSTDDSLLSSSSCIVNFSMEYSFSLNSLQIYEYFVI